MELAETCPVGSPDGGECSSTASYCSHSGWLTAGSTEYKIKTVMEINIIPVNWMCSHQPFFVRALEDICTPDFWSCPSSETHV